MRQPFGSLILAVVGVGATACLVGDFHPCQGACGEGDLAGDLSAIPKGDMNTEMGMDMSEPRCRTKEDCAGRPESPVCAPSGACVECLEAMDCVSASAPVCRGDHTCGGCGGASDCSRFVGKVCNTGSGACVECESQDDCEASHQTCDTARNRCAACGRNEECTSGLCCLDGRLPGGGLCTAGECIDKSILLYVNNASSAACSDSGPCSFAQPCCTVQKGLDASAASGTMPPKLAIAFAGEGYAEGLKASPTQNAGGDYIATAIGVGGPVVSASGAPIALITGLSGKQVNVTLEGFIFDGSSASNGIKVIGDATDYATTVLTLSRSTVENTPMENLPGITTAANCTLNMDSVTVSNNKGGGILLDGSDFTLTNLLIVGNGTPTTAPGTGSSFGGISIGGSRGELGKMNMANLTVVENKAKTTAIASGLVCQTTPTTLLNTVVLGNSNVEIDGMNCTPDHSAFKGALLAGTGTNNIDLATCTATQLFSGTGATPYMPVSGTGPCILVDVGTNTGAPDHDLIGTKRPQPSPSGVADIGAFEKRQP